jgi:hypothetical protein
MYVPSHLAKIAFVVGVPLVIRRRCRRRHSCCSRCCCCCAVFHAVSQRRKRVRRRFLRRQRTSVARVIGRPLAFLLQLRGKWQLCQNVPWEGECWCYAGFVGRLQIHLLGIRLGEEIFSIERKRQKAPKYRKGKKPKKKKEKKNTHGVVVVAMRMCFWSLKIVKHRTGAHHNCWTLRGAGRNWWRV